VIPAATPAVTPPATPATGPDRGRLLGALKTGLHSSWQTGLARKPRLTPAAMCAAAERRVGHGDFGPTALWRPALELLLGELRREARLNAIGRTIAYGQLVGILAQRAHAYALWAERPEILAQPLGPPIIVLGQMRSGSTRLQRLLACDERFAHTRFFESWQPIPRGRPGVDDRKVRAAAALAAARLINPRFDAIHPTALSAPDEEIGFHAFSLCGAPFEAQWRVPAFTAYWESQAMDAVYGEFRRLLQTVAWARGEQGARPWILKVPQFMQDLPALLRAFPDARLLCLARDPAEIVASSASLALNQMQIQSDHVDPHWIGREWLRKVALRERIARDTRAARPQTPQLDIAFAAMNRDWQGEMRRVYAFLGLPLPAAVLRRMEAYVARARGHADRRPAYSLAQFGLTRRDVAAALADQPAPLAAE
jgi:hypothetical protein